jgi:hypothetical protein
MKYKAEDSFFIIRIDRGEEIIAKLMEFCRENNVFCASFTGIGAVEKAEIGHYDVETKEYSSQTYEEKLEITNITGNIATMNNEPYIHAHVMLSDKEMKLIGGHLKSAVVAATCEIFLTTVATKVNRKYSEEIGLNLLEL